MKKIIMILVTGFLLISVSVFAQDVLIFNGNLEVGAADLSGSLEVESADNRNGIVGITGGTGAAVYGTNADSVGYAGYFDGKVHIKSNLTIDGTYAHTHLGNDIFGGEMQDSLAIEGNFTVGEYITINDSYKINNVTVLDAPGLNTFVGKSAGSVSTGDSNSFFGYLAGQSNTTGGFNTFVGSNAGQSNTFLGYNTYVGSGAGQANQGGVNNTFIGYNAGNSNQWGGGNVFIGYQAGMNEGGSNKLYIDNSNTVAPLIHGDFSSNIVTINNNLTVNSILKLIPSATPPQTCTGASDAGMLYHDSSNALCWCNGESWVPLAGGTCS